MSPPPPGRLAAELAGGPGIGPAGLSAALDLGLGTQVSRFDIVAVPQRVPRHPGSVRMVSRAASTRRRTERLSPAEVALLEVLRDWGVVEVPDREAARRIAELFDAGTLRVGKLVRASVTEPARARERLRHILIGTGRTDDADAIPPARSRPANRELALE